MKTPKDIAVLIPCYNEEITVKKVVKDFQKTLPQAKIYVFDNNSKDRTAAIAEEAGAIVIPSPIQGKGNVVKHMFDEVDAQIYVMADGDDTYPAEDSPRLIKLLLERKADMVVGSRLSRFEGGAFRNFHMFGNRLVAWLISILFGTPVVDVLSGFRVFNRDFVKSVPLISGGFEIETEITLQAAAKRFYILESPIDYRKRPEGSYSKLNTFSDGALVLRSIFIIFRYYKPFLFFSVISLLLAILSLLSGLRPIMEYYEHSFVYAVPRAILASGLGILSVFSFTTGLILDQVLRLHNEKFILIRKLLRNKQ